MISNFWCLLFAIAAALAAAPPDPGGWSKAKWGMTAKQILTAFDGQAVELEGRVPKPDRTFGDSHLTADVGIPSYEIAGVSVRVFFLCESRGLTRVEIAAVDPDPDTFLRLEAALVEKYGKPWHNKGDEITQSGWTLPTTQITLRHVQIQAPPLPGGSRQITFRSLWLTYSQRTRAATDDL